MRRKANVEPRTPNLIREAMEVYRKEHIARCTRLRDYEIGDRSVWVARLSRSPQICKGEREKRSSF